MLNRVFCYALLTIGIGAIVWPAGPARAGTLWYNGDADGRDAQANGIGASPVPDSLVYDNFVVPAGTTWTITGAFSTDLMNYTGVTDAYWEIRSGVSAGNGGTLLASGTSTATQTDLGYSLFGFEVYSVTASGLSVTLGPGTYYLTIAPVSPSTGGLPANYSYVATTSGTNAVGSPAGDDGHSYMTSSGYGLNFTPATDPSVEGPGTWDYSMGVIGVAAAPEPSGVVMLAIGGLGVAGLIRVRGRRRERVGATA